MDCAIKAGEQVAKTDAQLTKTDLKLKNLSEVLGGIANTQGDVTEEYFVNSFGANPVLGNMKYERVEVQRKIIEAATGKKFEVDILLVNGKTIAIIDGEIPCHERCTQTADDHHCVGSCRDA